MHRDERGFTLIELMVVVLIIAILLAVAIPTFLGARRRAQDRAAQSTLRNALTAARSVFVDQEDYALATATALESAEETLKYVGTGLSNDHQEVSTWTGCLAACAPGMKHTRFLAAALADNGVCWFIQEVVTPGAVNSGVKWEREEGVPCTSTNAPAYDSVTPPDKWEAQPGNTRA